MTNEFGAKLDRAGYAPSIMQTIRPGSGCCWLCGKPAGGEKMDRHEPWGGANRRKSMELGLWVELHHIGCHEGPGSVHGGNGDAARQLRIDAQTAAMMRYGWSREEWIARFGKSELSEEECRKLTAVSRAVKKAAERAPVNVDGENGGWPRGNMERAPTAARRVPSHGMVPTKDGRGAGARRTAGDIIRELWPKHATAQRSGFQLLDDPDLPY